jgi:hypothetical protein
MLNLVQPEQNSKLYRSCCLDKDADAVLRHRGESPRRAALFFKNPDLNFHAAQLASLYLIYRLVYSAAGGITSGFRLGSLESGALLCRAYEAYLQLHTAASISFEHAWFLWSALARRDEVGVSRCRACGGVHLHDLLARHKHACGNCAEAAAAPN